VSECGFVGLGRMGGAMARRLLDAGHRVIAYDVAEPARAALAAHGAHLTTSARAVAELAPVVFLSLPTPEIVLETALGAQGLARGSRLEICVDLSTSGPEVAIKLAAALFERRIAALEAPVSGGVKGAREGTLSVMVSGPTDAWDRVRPLLEILGRPFYMGARAGAGQTMKLVNNLLGACAIAITAEGMAIGTKAGLDPVRMIEVLNVSSGRSSATQDKWPRAVLPRTFDFGFTAGLCLKDVRLCLAAARSLQVPLGVGTAVSELLERTVGTLGADSDFTAMARIVERDAGLDPEPSSMNHSKS
jgi:3-hydroxyisobutyrate dehydrogenase-like beta-hydroxyacid dehydrogenase